MKYIVAVKYISSEEEEDLFFETELFEFKSKKDRSEFIKDIRHLAQDIALSQIEEVE